MNRFKYYLIAIWYGYKSKIVYRLSAWLGSIAGVATFLIQIIVWKTLLGSGEQFDTTFETMLTYLVITQLATGFVQSFSGNTVNQLIYSGDISVFLVRPLNLKTHIFLDGFGKNLFNVFLLNLPVCLVLFVFFEFYLPQSILVVFISLLMLINGVIMIFHYRYILGMVSFWLIKNPFTSWGFQNAEAIFSGKVLPIWLSPVWLATITQFLPFRYFTYEAVSLFVGKSSIDQAWKSLLIQVFWVFLFILIEKKVSSCAMKKLVVQGG